MIATGALRNSPVVALLVAVTAIAVVWWMLLFPQMFALAVICACVVGSAVLLPGWAWTGVLLASLALVPIARLEQAPLVNVSPLGGEGRMIALVWAGGLVGLLRSKRPIRFPARPAAAVVALYALAMFVALLIGEVSSSGLAFSISRSFLVRHLAYMSAFFLPAVLLRDRADLDKALRLILAIGVAFAALGIVEWAIFHDLLHLPGTLGDVYADARKASAWEDRVRFPFVSDSPNSVAMIGVVWLALLTVTAARYPSRPTRLFAAIGALITLAYVFSTQSRTGFAGLAALSVSVPLALRQVHSRWQLLLILLALVAGARAVWNQLPSDRAFSRGSSAYQTRLELQRHGVDAFLAQPVLGHGLAYSEQPIFTATAHTGPEGALSSQNLSVHSQYLSEAVDKGFAGPLLLMILLVALARTSRLTSRSPGNAEAVLGAGWFAALGSVALTMLAGTLLNGGAFSTVFWLFSGLVAWAAAGQGSNQREPAASLVHSRSGARPAGVQRPA